MFLLGCHLFLGAGLRGIGQWFGGSCLLWNWGFFHCMAHWLRKFDPLASASCVLGWQCAPSCLVSWFLNQVKLTHFSGLHFHRECALQVGNGLHWWQLRIGVCLPRSRPLLTAAAASWLCSLFGLLPVPQFVISITLFLGGFSLAFLNGVLMGGEQHWEPCHASGTGRANCTIYSGTTASETGSGTWFRIKLKGVLFFQFHGVTEQCRIWMPQCSIGEPEPSRSWHYFVKSVCCKKPRARNWWLELGFQLETRIPVCDLTSLSKLSRLHTEGWVFRCTFLEVDGWEWIWLTAHRLLFKIPKGILN